MVMRWKKLRIMNRNAEAWVCETDDATERLQRLLPQKQVFTVSNSCNQILNIRKDGSRFRFRNLPP